MEKELNSTEDSIATIIRNIDEIVFNMLQQKIMLDISDTEILLKLSRLRKMYVDMGTVK